jgi:hypothetical protein
MVARNVIKNLAAAEDLLHGVGEVEQLRNGEVYSVSRIDIPLGLTSVAELANVDPIKYSRVRVGNTEFEYVSGAWQERLVLAPYPLVAGLTLTERYNQVISNGVVSKYVGVLPYMTTGSEDITAAPWQVLVTGGAGGGIVFAEPPASLAIGATYFNPATFEIAFAYNDGDSSQYITFPLAKPLGGSSGGSTEGEANTASNLGAGTGVFASKAGLDLQFKSLVAGSNVTIANDANTVTISATGSGGTTDHSALTNRNIADQHTIASITSLQSTLDGKAPAVHSHTIANVTGLQAALDAKQATLVSGTTIKTINGVTLLGSGDLVVGAGGGETNTASNLGAGTGVFASKVGVDLRFKSLVAGSNVTIANDANTVTISATGSGGTTDHSALTNRNIADQHTIASITSLQSTLDGKASTAVVTTTVNGLMIAADKVRLNGMADNATANSPDATLLARANHTGTQAISTVTGLQIALDGKQAVDADLTAIAAISTNGVLQRTGANTWSTLVDVKEIVVSATAPTDTTKLWLDIN